MFMSEVGSNVQRAIQLERRAHEPVADGLGGVLSFSFTKSRNENTRCYFNDEGVVLLLKQKNSKEARPRWLLDDRCEGLLVGGERTACEVGSKRSPVF